MGAEESSKDTEKVRDLSSYTVFVRNLPPDATEEQVCVCLRVFVHACVRV